MVEAIEVPFGTLNWVGPKNNVLDKVQIHAWKEAYFVRMGNDVVYRATYRETVAPATWPFYKLF